MKKLFNITPLKTVVGVPPGLTNTYSSNFRAAGGQYITFGNRAALSFAYNAAYSLSVWMKTTNLTQNYKTILGKVVPSPYNGYEIALKNQTIDVDLAVDNTHYIERTSNNVITVSGQWYHLVVTYSGSGAASGMKLYVGGSVVTLNTITDSLGTGTATNSLPFTIGSRGDFSNFWEGNSDEIAVYNKELSAGEVAAIYNSGHPNVLTGLGSASNLQLWCRMGDGDATGANNVIDHSANAFTGTATNFFTADFQTDVP